MSIQEDQVPLFRDAAVVRPTTAKRHYHKAIDTLDLADIYTFGRADIMWEAFAPSSERFNQRYDRNIRRQSKYIMHVDSTLPNGFEMVDITEAIELLLAGQSRRPEDADYLDHFDKLLAEHPMSSRGLISTVERESQAFPAPVWIDMLSPTEEELAQLAEALGIHPLTVEDCVQSHLLSESSYEKVEQFHEYVFVVLDERFQFISQPQAQTSEDSPAPATYANTINFIIFESVVISIHQEQIHTLAQVMYRLLIDEPAAFLRSDWVMYSFLDAITDKFFEFIRILREEVANLDAQALTLSDQQTIDKHVVLKRISVARNIMNDLRLRIMSKEGLIGGITKICEDSLTVLRKRAKKRAKAKQKLQERLDKLPRQDGEAPSHFDPLDSVILKSTGKEPLLHVLDAPSEPGVQARRPQLIIQPRTVVYMRDILDHVHRMAQILRLTAEHISTISDTYVARLSIDMTSLNNVMNASMRRFAAVATIFLPLTLVSGMWGMNVKVPGNEVDSLWWFGGIATVFAFVIVMMTIAFWFKRWL